MCSWGRRAQAPRVSWSRGADAELWKEAASGGTRAGGQRRGTHAPRFGRGRPPPGPTRGGPAQPGAGVAPPAPHAVKRRRRGPLPHGATSGERGRGREEGREAGGGGSGGGVPRPGGEATSSGEEEEASYFLKNPEGEAEAIVYIWSTGFGPDTVEAGKINAKRQGSA